MKVLMHALAARSFVRGLEIRFTRGGKDPGLRGCPPPLGLSPYPYFSRLFDPFTPQKSERLRIKRLFLIKYNLIISKNF
jgi:hypothetical protein